MDPSLRRRGRRSSSDVRSSPGFPPVSAWSRRTIASSGGRPSASRTIDADASGSNPPRDNEIIDDDCSTSVQRRVGSAFLTAIRNRTGACAAVSAFIVPRTTSATSDVMDWASSRARTQGARSAARRSRRDKARVSSAGVREGWDVSASCHPWWAVRACVIWMIGS